MLSALKPRSLTVRLAIWYAGVFILFSLVVFALYYVAVGQILSARLDSELQEDMQELHTIMRQGGPEAVLADLQHEATTDNAEEVLYYFGTLDHQTLFSSDSSQWDEEGLDQLRRLSPYREHFADLEEDELHARILTAPVGDSYLVQLGESVDNHDEFLDVLTWVSAVALLLAILFGALTGWVMSRKAMHDIAEVSRAARDVAHGRLDRRVANQASDKEISELTSTFNTMVDRIRALVFGMREMTDNIAHDMRSPLGRIRASAEQILSTDNDLSRAHQHAGEALEECDKLLHMIDTTLDLAETEMGVAHSNAEQTDVSQMLADACELFEPVAENKQISLITRIVPALTLTANVSQLQRLFANLLENALKYTPQGGSVVVSLEPTETHLSACFQDSGIGISVEDQARVFNRYFRCDSSRSEPGCGLGLSLAKAIAKAHDGDITLNSSPGKGSEFTVSLARHPRSL